MGWKHKFPKSIVDVPESPSNDQPIYYIGSTTYPSKAMSSSLESLVDFSDGIAP